MLAAYRQVRSLRIHADVSCPDYAIASVRAWQHCDARVHHDRAAEQDQRVAAHRLRSNGGRQPLDVGRAGHAVEERNAVEEERARERAERERFARKPLTEKLKDMEALFNDPDFDF